MKPSRAFCHGVSCHGVTLIELMLGVAIGLGVILAAGVAYQAQRQSWLLMQAIASLHHNANAALDHLQTSVQSADAAVLKGTANGIVTTASSPSNSGDMTEGKTGSDGLALSRFGALKDFDCQGNHADNYAFIRDSYQVNKKQELTCKNTELPGSTYQALAEGVEDFQVRFAERSQSATPGSAPHWQWKNAAQILSDTEVMAIDICLRMVSTQLANAPVATVLGCQNEALLNDGKLRRVFRRVVAIRSHLTSGGL